MTKLVKCITKKYCGGVVFGEVGMGWMVWRWLRGSEGLYAGGWGCGGLDGV